MIIMLLPTDPERLIKVREMSLVAWREVHGSPREEKIKQILYVVWRLVERGTLGIRLKGGGGREYRNWGVFGRQCGNLVQLKLPGIYDCDLSKKKTNITKNRSYFLPSISPYCREGTYCFKKLMFSCLIIFILTY